jgi:hypothetical protein
MSPVGPERPIDPAKAMAAARLLSFGYAPTIALTEGTGKEHCGCVLRDTPLSWLGRPKRATRSKDRTRHGMAGLRMRRDRLATGERA